MKKWLMRALGCFGVLALILAVLLIVFWSRLQILVGTQGISGSQGEIPGTQATIEPAVAGPEDWPAWRGARNDARSSVTGIRTDWSGGLRKLWEVDFLCQGRATASWAAPVVRGNRLVIPGRDDDRDLLFGLDPETGEMLWMAAYEAPAGDNHGPGARATPFIDEDRVYNYGRSGDLSCWKLDDGTLLWRRNVRDEGGQEPVWGQSSSPLVVGDRVFVQGGGSARTLAYDKLSGDLVWRSGQGVAGYAAFATLDVADQTQLVVFHGKGLAGLDMSDGAVLWETAWETPYDVNATTPIVDGNRVLITSGYGRGAQLVAVDQGGPEVVWASDALAAQHSDPFIIDGHIYGYSGDSSQNRGSFKCLDLESGGERWSSDEIGWGTCTWVDGHLLCIDIRGNLHLVKATPQGLDKVAGMERVFGKARPVWTVPVVANGRLYLRFKQRLACYDLIG